MELCLDCNKEEIKVKKWKLCKRCYQRKYTKGALYGGLPFSASLERKCKPTQMRILIDREFEFVRNFFSHDEWIRHPCVLRLSDNGSRYEPDFYDAKRNVFIEVAGTRQGWDQRKDKLESAMKRYPKLNFEARKVSGEQIYLHERVNWNGADAL